MSAAKKDQIREKQPADIRIIYAGECAKLTARGKGLLSYELAVNETTEENYIRIAANSQGGTCSFEWINLQEVEDLLENESTEKQPFSAALFSKLYTSKSANNHGYLAAILKAEKVIGNSAEQGTQLTSLSFDGIKAKIETLQKDGIDLTDNVAASLKLREEKKAERKAVKVAATTKVKDADVKDKLKKKPGKGTE